MSCSVAAVAPCSLAYCSPWTDAHRDASRAAWATCWYRNTPIPNWTIPRTIRNTTGRTTAVSTRVAPIRRVLFRRSIMALVSSNGVGLPGGLGGDPHLDAPAERPGVGD